MNKSTLGDNKFMAFSVKEGTYNPRVYFKHYTSTSRQYLELTSSYSTGVGRADFIFSYGNVGINTTTPPSKFSVYQNSADHNSFIYSNTESTNYYILRCKSGSTDKFTLNADGKVGIGINSPETKLQVSSGVVTAGSSSATLGSLQFAGDYTNGNILNTYGSQYSSGATSIGYAVKQKSGSSGIVSSAGNASLKKGMLIIDNELEFLSAPASIVSIDSDVTMISRFIIKENGNTGIGITSPDNKLEVDGTIRATEVVVETGWADYVFNDDYNNMSIEQLEEFIKSNKHLPGIPTATEVENNGVSLGDMNALLLKKIEELTLYIIELNNQIKEIKSDDQH